MRERIGGWIRKHPDTTCRIGGGIFAGNGAVWGWFLANASLDILSSPNSSILEKIAILGVNLVMAPFLAIKIADGVSDIITGKHHSLFIRKRTTDPWASEEARLLLEEIRVRHQPTFQVG